jgi:hypothetical protein
LPIWVSLRVNMSRLRYVITIVIVD